MERGHELIRDIVDGAYMAFNSTSAKSSDSEPEVIVIKRSNKLTSKEHVELCDTLTSRLPDVPIAYLIDNNGNFERDNGWYVIDIDKI